MCPNTFLLAMLAVGIGPVHIDAYEWNLNPIEVRGQHLYDSVTNKRFNGAGIAFPNLGDVDVTEWIKTLQRIKNESPLINMVRVYTPPACAIQDGCFEPFMQEADTLGIYVLLSASGTTWGWIPIDSQACGTPPTANGCYKNGGALGYGQKVVQAFNFPNTLALILANEVDRQDMYPYEGMLKGFARDLKSYMNMCNTDPQSPTKGKMRQIPLAYAKSDDGGDAKDKLFADYLFCGGSNISIDIFGLNVERFCDSTHGPFQYNLIDKWVGEAKYPGAFMFSEMGCSNSGGSYAGARDWAQVPGIFQKYTAIDAFSAYTYFDPQPIFSMFDGPSSTAQIKQDGKNFFNQMAKVGSGPSDPPQASSVPECTPNMLGVKMDTVESVLWYDTGAASLPANCPKPYQVASAAVIV